MRNEIHGLKVEGLNSIDEVEIKKVFKRLSDKNLELLLKQDTIYFSTHNYKVINYIYESLKNLYNPSIKLEFIENDNLTQIASLIFPLPENESVYDIVSILTDQPYDKNLDEVRDISDIKETIINTVFCNCCYKSTPSEISFCIHCAFETKKTDSIIDYQIKINKMDYESKVRLSKYLSDISEKDYSLILNTFNNLPIVIEIKSTNSFMIDIVDYLNINNISYNIIESTIDKLLSKIYYSINLGELSNFYIAKSNIKIIIDTMKNIRSLRLKNIITNNLYQAYQIINHIRNSDKNSIHILKSTENEINKILEQSMYLIKKLDQLEIYLSDNSVEQIEKEILKLNDKISLLDNLTLKKINQENLKLKNNELKEIKEIVSNYEILNNQVESINDLFKSVRTKIAYINTNDIQQNNGNYKEFDNIKHNLINKIRAIDEVLRY